MAKKYFQDQNVDGDEFSIYQTTYHGEDIRKDIENKYIMNSSFVDTLPEHNYIQALKVLDIDVCEFIKNKILPIENNLSKFHTDLHNIGHFCGSFPYDQSKNINIYSSIEEYRSCLQAIAIFDQLDFDIETKNAFALNVFLTRFLNYGFFAYQKVSKNYVDIREITSGLLSFEYLKYKKVVVKKSLQGTLAVDVYKIRNVLIEDLQNINNMENSKSLYNLKKYANWRIGLTYPDNKMSDDAMFIYTKLAKKSYNEIKFDYARLHFRSIRLQDSFDLFRYNTGNVKEYFIDFQTINDAQKFVIECLDDAGSGDKIELSVLDDAVLIGGVSIYSIKQDPEIGIWVAPNFQNKGYATKMLNGIISFAKENTDIKTIKYQADCDNISSQKLAIKCGFALQGKVKNSFVYSIILDK